MLVLTRSCDEEIRIGDDIVVRVLDVKGDRVRIGIQAPSEIAVHRQEVYLEIERANQESLQIASGGLKGVSELLNAASREPKNKNAVVPAGNPAKRRGKVHTEVSHGA